MIALVSQRIVAYRPKILVAERNRRFRPLTGGWSTEARHTSGQSNVTGAIADRSSFGSASVNWSTAHEPISMYGTRIVVNGGRECAASSS